MRLHTFYCQTRFDAMWNGQCGLHSPLPLPSCTLLCTHKANERTSNNALEVMMANGESKGILRFQKSNTHGSGCLCAIVHVWICLIFLSILKIITHRVESSYRRRRRRRRKRKKNREKNSNKSTQFLLYFLLRWACIEHKLLWFKKTARPKSARAVKLFQH